LRDNNCRLCQIIAGEFPAQIIAENEQVIAFLSLENHPLVVTREHIPDIYSLPAHLGAAVMEMVVKVSKSVKKALKCDGVYLTQSNEPAGGQTVFHFHVHVYPAWDEGFNRAITEFVHRVSDRENVTEEMKVELAKKLRNHITSKEQK